MQPRTNAPKMVMENSNQEKIILKKQLGMGIPQLNLRVICDLDNLDRRHHYKEYIIWGRILRANFRRNRMASLLRFQRLFNHLSSKDGHSLAHTIHHVKFHFGWLARGKGVKKTAYPVLGSTSWTFE